MNNPTEIQLCAHAHISPSTSMHTSLSHTLRRSKLSFLFQTMRELLVSVERANWTEQRHAEAQGTPACSYPVLGVHSDFSIHASCCFVSAMNALICCFCWVWHWLCLSAKAAISCRFRCCSVSEL